MQANDWLNEQVSNITNLNGGKVSFLLVGRTGTGKSSMVNVVFENELARTNAFEPETMEVRFYEGKFKGINMTLIDTPGLCDDLEEIKNDKYYVDKLNNSIKEFDCICFFSYLMETRISIDEKRAIKIISNAFGDAAWERAVIIFTHSRFVPVDEFERKLEERTKKIRECIEQYSIKAVVGKIPSVAIDTNRTTNPDGREWLTQLYSTIFGRVPLKAPRTKVFVSYSHSDKQFLEEIRKHFKPFIKNIDFWDDTKILPGQQWKEEIRKAINETKVAILLISADFLGSDFITSNELPLLLDAAEKNGASILILVLKPCLIEEFPELIKFQALHKIDTPLTKMNEVEKDELYVNLVRHTKRILEQ